MSVCERRMGRGRERGNRERDIQRGKRDKERDREIDRENGGMKRKGSLVGR